jgi:hypothetical protein
MPITCQAIFNDLWIPEDIYAIKLGAQEQRRIIMVGEWLKEIKENCDAEFLGMILIHNRIVRGKAKR